MIDHSNKTIFIHIPKTGGTSIEEYFFPNYDEFLYLKYNRNKAIKGDVKHADVNNIIPRSGDLTQEQFDAYYKFTCVRNPWDLVASYFVYHNNMLPGRFENIKNIFNPKNSEQLNHYNRWVRYQLRPQLDWITKDDQVIVDKIIRFEDINKGFQEVLSDLNLSGSLPFVNKSEGRKNYSEYYDDEAIEIVANHYKKDIEHFNYNYG